MSVIRILSTAYLLVGCWWTWRHTWAFTTIRWRSMWRSLRSMPLPAPSVVASVLVLPLWLYDGLLDVTFWPMSMRRAWRLKKWLKVHVPPVDRNGHPR
jgi:hypothetical protein